jgi:glycosyltransferase involved in cell wall biosynthesis
VPIGGRIVRTTERAVRNVAGRLSPERGEALLQAAKAGYSLVTGRRASRRGVIPRKEPRVDPIRFRQASSAYQQGDLPRALDLADGLVRRYPGSTQVLRLRRDVASRMGEITERAAMIHRLHTLDPIPGWLESERIVLGRIRETTPGWLPSIPGPARPVVSESPDVILHLLKESSPHLTTGFTMRSRYNLIAAAEAGLRPVVVTALGFPRLLGVRDVEPLEIVDGIPHHRLDLGPFYPLDGPVDVALEDTAWLVARLAQRIRPAVIHASSGHRGFEFALIGGALRRHIDRPLVYEVRSFFESTWGGDEAFGESGEQYQRRFDAETRAMQQADHVITIAEAMRTEIIERGVDPGRITVIPNGVDADLFRPEPKDPGLVSRYGLEGAFTFGYVSNLDHPRENQELLIDATKVLQQRGRRVRCLIVGDGRRREELESYARHAGVGGGVRFTGRVPHDEVSAHYAALDAFVVPRKDERAARMVTPLKPYEALAMERPLVVADLPALVEIAAPEERGLVFREGDAASLTDALERLIDDPALGERIGRAGRAWVARERSWTDNGPMFREVYRHVLDEWAGRKAADSKAADRKATAA